jgi:hypothetical protein
MTANKAGSDSRTDVTNTVVLHRGTTKPRVPGHLAVRCVLVALLCAATLAMALDVGRRRLRARRNFSVHPARQGRGRRMISPAFPAMRTLQGHGHAARRYVQQDTPDAYRKVEGISTHYGAHPLVVDPVTHRVLLMEAENTASLGGVKRLLKLC